MPPGILEWIIDFFVKPVRDAVAGVFISTIGAVKKEEFDKAFVHSSPVTKQAEASIRALLVSKSPITFEEAIKRRDTFYKTSQSLFLGKFMDVISAEVMGLGLVDMPANMLPSEPIYRAQMELDSAMWTAEFESGMLPVLRRYWLSQHQPLLPESYRLATMAAKGILTEEVYKNAMAESGLSNIWADSWREDQFIYPQIETSLALLRRGRINDDVFQQWMIKNSVRQNVAQDLLSLKEVIPPLDDLIRFAVREAFGDHSAAVQYPTYESWAQMMGLSKEKAAWYWYAHWERIPTELAYDNLARGYWTPEKFMDMLRIKDVHPDDRQDILNVAYLPLTIRELGYAFDVGAVTREDIVKYRRWGRLSPADADIAATSLILYRTEAEREAVRREHLHLFALGKETEAQFKENLIKLATSPPAVDLWIERGKLETERRAKEAAMPEPRIVSSSEALHAFKTGLRNEDWTRKALLDLLWTTERVNVAIEQAKREMEETKAKEAIVEERELSITQIRDLYKAGKITVEQIPVLLKDLQFSSAYAVMLSDVIVQEVEAERAPRILTKAEVGALYDVGVYDVETVFNKYLSLNYSYDDAADLTLATIVSVLLPDLRAWYSKGWINADTVYNELIATGMPSERAQEMAMTIIKAEQPERLATEKDLTKAEIIKGWKNGILNDMQAIELLMSLNYDEYEAQYLLAINAVAAAGDPEGYWEMRTVTELSKKARGLPALQIPIEAVQVEKQIKLKKTEIFELQQRKASEEDIGKAAVELASLESQLRAIVSKLKSI
jgi:hypothetical protein